MLLRQREDYLEKLGVPHHRGPGMINLKSAEWMSEHDDGLNSRPDHKIGRAMRAGVADAVSETV